MGISSTKAGRRLTLLAVPILVAASAFAVAYALKDDDQLTSAKDQPIPPSEDVTPVPGATPNTGEPFWDAPYVNKERKDKKFEGEIAGIKIKEKPEGSSGFEVCAERLNEVTAEEGLAAALRPGTFSIDSRKLAPEMKPEGVPEAWRCRDQIADISWVFHVAPNTPDVNAGGSSVTVIRTAGPAVAGVAGSAGRWAEGAANGHSAVMMRPIVRAGDHIVGACMAGVVVDGVFTQVIATAAAEQFCVRTLERVLG